MSTFVEEYRLVWALIPILDRMAKFNTICSKYTSLNFTQMFRSIFKKSWTLFFVASLIFFSLLW